MTYITVYNLSINSNYRILANGRGAKLQVNPEFQSWGHTGGLGAELVCFH